LWTQSGNGGPLPDYSTPAAETPDGTYGAGLQTEQLQAPFDFDFDSVLHDPLNFDNTLPITQGSNDISLSGIQASSPLAFHPSLQPKESSNDIAISPGLQANWALSTGSQVASNVLRCDECHETFQKPYQLKRHSKKHTRPFKCTTPSCSQSFQYKKDLSRHKKARHSEEIPDYSPLYCPINGCKFAEGAGQSFSRRDNLERHIRSKHGS
jgi:hypothetical protein